MARFGGRRIKGPVRVLSLYAHVSIGELWTLFEADWLAREVCTIRRIQRPGHRRFDVFISLPLERKVWNQFIARYADSLEMKGYWRPNNWPNTPVRKKTNSDRLSTVEERREVAKPPKARKMSMATWNINGLLRKSGEVAAFLRQHQPDVLAVQETREKKGVHDLTISGYQFFGSPGLGREAGWGTGFYVADHIVPFVELLEGIRGEQLWLHIRPEPSSAGSYVGSVYIPPNRDRSMPPKSLRTQVRKFRKKASSASVFLLGDLNMGS